ncbi:MAG: Crp/Fnr family transcriptional regulator [Defluviitaleaceae bacterium]|nr:Crp/Fnr family transcriptional regulator [Defluviitaleaceae bacterium]
MTDVFQLKNPEIFDSLSKPKVFEKSEIIYVQGDEASYIYYLKSGKVQIYVGSASGSEKILATFSGGSLFGKSAFFDNLPRASNARALKKSEIIRINKQMMTEIIGNYPKFAVDMLEYLSKTIRVFSNQIESISFLRADKRTAMYIVDNLPAEPGNNQVFCTHDEIAGVIGASRVTVSKILREFSETGWIDTLYKAIRVNNAEALKKFILSTV